MVLITTYKYYFSNNYCITYYLSPSENKISNYGTTKKSPPPTLHEIKRRDKLLYKPTYLG